MVPTNASEPILIGLGLGFSITIGCLCYYKGLLSAYKKGRKTLFDKFRYEADTLISIDKETGEQIEYNTDEFLKNLK